MNTQLQLSRPHRTAVTAAFAAVGATAFALYSRSWRSWVIFLYDIPAAILVFSFVGSTLAGLLFRENRIWIRVSLLVPLTVIPVVRTSLGWPISGHVTDTLAVALFDGLQPGVPALRRAAVFVPVAIVVVIRWLYLDSHGHLPTYLGSCAGLAFGVSALVLQTRRPFHREQDG